MVNVPSVPEIITVNSEALQEQIRDLLPSQNGFGSELQASNVITPIIDLTATAEGSGLPTSLQQAIAFGSQTTFSVTSSSAVVANSPGFYRLIGGAGFDPDGSDGHIASISMSDGFSTKTVWSAEVKASADGGSTTLNVDYIFFLRAGDSLSVDSNTLRGSFKGSVRQIATGDGTLVNPNGYPL